MTAPNADLFTLLDAAQGTPPFSTVASVHAEQLLHDAYNDGLIKVHHDGTAVSLRWAYRLADDAQHRDLLRLHLTPTGADHLRSPR